jgi:hypothetical protein
MPRKSFLFAPMVRGGRKEQRHVREKRARLYLRVLAHPSTSRTEERFIGGKLAGVER